MADAVSEPVRGSALLNRRARKLVGALVVLALVACVAATAIVMTTKPAWYLRWRYPLRYEPTILAHAKNYDLPPALIAAVIEQESGFDPAAKSPAGAVGLMQLTASTAQGIATRTGGAKFHQSDLLTPELNIRYGCWYLEHLHEKYAGYDEGYILVLAAYNAGQGKVDTWLATRGHGEHLGVDDIPFAETRAYVHKVLQMQRYYQKAYPALA